MGAIVTSLGTTEPVVIDDSEQTDEKTIKGLYVKFWVTYAELMR